MAGVSFGLLSGPATLTMFCTYGFAPVSTFRARSAQAHNVGTGAHHGGPSLQWASPVDAPSRGGMERGRVSTGRPSSLGRGCLTGVTNRAT